MDAEGEYANKIIVFRMPRSITAMFSQFRIDF